MKGQTILSSIFLGLTLPTFAFASVSTSSSLYSSNHGQFNTVENVEIAQRYLSYQDVSGRLYYSESQILNIAREYSEGQQVRWDSISVESINNQEIKLNVHGKIMIKRKPPIRVGLFLQRNSQGSFTIVNYDYSTGKRCRRTFCKPKVRGALQNLPSHFSRFQQVLDSILA